MIKIVSLVRPLAALPLEECERHYRDVHMPFVRATARSLPGFLTYHNDLVLTRYDVAGGWSQRPDIWRIATARFEGDPRLPLEPMADGMNEDHRHFLSHYRFFKAVEETLVDRLSGQTALAKFALHIDRSPELTREEAERELQPRVERLAELASGAFGLRLLVRDRVLAECETRPIDEPGQECLPHVELPDTPRIAHLDLYFDQHQWGREFFAAHRQELLPLLGFQAFRRVKLYELDETGGVDKR